MAVNGVELAYDFVPPPETIVFEPTKEEFKDAMAYIEKIRPVAETYGICKIRPPEDWQPPFAVDVDKLRFTPRIQRLNELEAHTRIKLNFLDQVAKFWELQGSTLKIPLVDKRALDLYTLKKYVQKEGGMEAVNLDKKWQKVADDMGYSQQNKNIPALLKAHYERIIYPLDIFEREEQKKLQQIKEEDDPDQEGEEKEYKPHNIPSRMGMKPPSDKNARRSQRGAAGDAEISQVKKEDPDAKSLSPANSFSKELARLQFFGAGPKMAGLPNEKAAKEKTRGMKLNFEYDPLAKYMCQTCGKGDAEEQMLLCDGCDDSYHTFCLMPPLAEIPKGDWRCPKCVAAEVSKPMEAFGFEQAQKEYTLQSFGEMADQFKSDYFNMPVHLIPTTLVEKEYWRILENIDEDVMIEYGADLHTMDHGSGFPMVTSKNLSKEDEAYTKSDWNLNRLPVASNSILRCIDMDISGMKVPWLYVGMCFSTFCWHTEDHWTPSINYMHWGEPKTWYGIPGKYAEKAEEVMRESAKELFSGQPDLLHHIVTTMNPNVLQAHGVPIYRTDQHAGEFIITFPRAYHAGFNQGYNLAEAVNFAPPDWLEMGRKCVEHYSIMRRYCVFCHDELVCNMASKADQLTLKVAVATYKDMLVMVESEKKLRRQLLEAGVTEAEREAFELLPDDERQCAICKTTCFLSALASVENKESDEIVCLRHFKAMECEPDKIILRYRYTLDELATFLMALKKRAESYDQWIDKVREALDLKGDDRLEFSELKELADEASERMYPETELLTGLTLTVEEAEKCQTVANQLGSKKVRTRTRGVADPKYRLTVEELELFANQLDTLPTKVSGHETVHELLAQVESFKREASVFLNMDLEEAKMDDKVKEMNKCIELGQSLDVDLEELGDLKNRYKQVEWLQEIADYVEDEVHLNNSSFEELKEYLETGQSLPSHPSIERALGQLSGLRIQVEEWEEKAKQYLNAKPRFSLPEVEKLVKEGEMISQGLPSMANLKDAVKKAKDWIAKADTLRSPDKFPYIDSLEALVARGRPLPVKLESLTYMETQVAQARAWRERTARVFLKKSNQSSSLLDILAPRTDIGNIDKRKKRQVKDDAATNGVHIQHPIYQQLSIKDLSNPQAIVKAFKDAEAREVQSIKEYRKNNDGGGDSPSTQFECGLCRDMFHPSHVPLPQQSMGKGKGQGPTSLRDIKFLCPNCLRSRRPRLETILSLLVSLKKLAVRLPEGEALQCLTDRAMDWRGRAQKCLDSPDVADSLSKLSDHSLKGTKTQKRSKGKQHDSSLSETDGENESAADTSMDSEDEAKINLKDERPPEIKLTNKSVNMLETLMIEGDLLEVTMDETQHIWRLLQATEPRRSKMYPDLNQLEQELENVREERIRQKKKRKIEQLAKAEADEDYEPEGRKKPRNEKRTEPARKRKKRDSSEVEEEQEDCSAAKCLRPTGKEVHWVQCDGCELWFHLHCIGLKPENVSEDEDFICKNCRPNRQRNKKRHWR